MIGIFPRAGEPETFSNALAFFSFAKSDAPDALDVPASQAVPPAEQSSQAVSDSQLDEVEASQVMDPPHSPRYAPPASPREDGEIPSESSRVMDPPHSPRYRPDIPPLCHREVGEISAESNSDGRENGSSPPGLKRSHSDLLPADAPQEQGATTSEFVPKRAKTDANSLDVFEIRAIKDGKHWSITCEASRLRWKRMYYNMNAATLEFFVDSIFELDLIDTTTRSINFDKFSRRFGPKRSHILVLEQVLSAEGPGAPCNWQIRPVVPDLPLPVMMVAVNCDELSAVESSDEEGEVDKGDEIDAGEYQGAEDHGETTGND